MGAANDFVNVMRGASSDFRDGLSLYEQMADRRRRQEEEKEAKAAALAKEQEAKAAAEAEKARIAAYNQDVYANDPKNLVAKHGFLGTNFDKSGLERDKFGQGQYEFGEKHGLDVRKQDHKEDHDWATLDQKDDHFSQDLGHKKNALAETKKKNTNDNARGWYNAKTARQKADQAGEPRAGTDKPETPFQTNRNEKAEEEIVKREQRKAFVNSNPAPTPENKQHLANLVKGYKDSGLLSSGSNFLDLKNIENIFNDKSNTAYYTALKDAKDLEKRLEARRSGSGSPPPAKTLTLDDIELPQ